MEIKIRGLDKFDEAPARVGLKLLSSEMDILGAKEGWQVVFDRAKAGSWDGIISWETSRLMGLPYAPVVARRPKRIFRHMANPLVFGGHG